ncbi:MAG: hypothetical protein LUG23_05830 [Oscillospiraceae bacterium]|nr:hypothetical protein [Oscillospiraceae bacterium]
MTTTADYYEGNMVTIKCPLCGKVKLRVFQDDIDSGAADSMICFDCQYEEMKAVDGFNPVNYMDYIEDTRLPDEFKEG